MLAKKYWTFNREVSTVAFAFPLWEKAAPEKSSLRGFTPGQKAGLRYERQVTGWLYSKFSLFLDHLGFRFVADGNAGIAIPDGVLLVPQKNLLVLIEVKIRHTDEAWRQLSRFYLPIVRKAFPGLTIRSLEVVKNFEPNIKLPVPVRVIQNFDEVAGFDLSDPMQHHVYIHRGRPN